MNLLKKIRCCLSLVLVSTILVSLSSPAFASASDNSLDIGSVNVACIEYISKDGSNIGTDETNPQYVLPESRYDISFLLDTSKLFVSGSIDGTPFSATGTLITTNENKNVLLYESSDSYENYDVAFMSVERELDESAIFFQDFYLNHPQSINVIKLYMQPNGMESLILIEIFIEKDFVSSLQNKQLIEYNSKQANQMQSWFTQYYAPIETPTSAPNSVISPLKKDYSETYPLFDSEVTFVFVLELYYRTPNIVSGGEGSGSYYISVKESRTDSPSPSLESSTQSQIHVQDINITVQSSPYLAFISLLPVRKSINDYNWDIGVDFSVSLSFGVGALSISASPSFTNKEKASDGDLILFDDYNDTVNGVRIVECGQLPKNKYLVDEGDQYGMHLEYMDAKDTGAYNGTIKVKFEYYINNGYEPQDSLEETRNTVATVAVKN